MLGFVAVGQIENDCFAVAFIAVVFIEDGLRHYIFLCGPVAQIAIAAAFTAKGEIAMKLGIRGRFADGAFVFHFFLPV